MPDAKSKKKLGIIFLINYFVFTDTTFGEILNSHVDDIENGFFSLSSYNHDPTIEYCFIKSTRALDKDGKIIEDSDPATKIYKPKYDQIEKKLKAGTPEEDLGNINLGNYDVLSTVLIMAKKMLKTDEYIIITYSHGNPFGTANGNVDKASEGAKNPSNDLIKSNKTLKFAYDYIGGKSVRVFDNSANIKNMVFEKHADSNLTPVKPDEEKKKDSIQTFKPDMLTNAEQHVALVRAFGRSPKSGSGVEPEKPIKLIINCACYVQNVDTLFSLRQIADYIVAASSSIPELSFDFARIINENIANNENRNFKSLAQNIVRDYNYLDILKPIACRLEEPSIKRTFEKQNDWIVLSAIDCKELNSFFTAFNNFTLLLINQISDEVLFKKLKEAKEGIVNFEMERLKKFIDEDESLFEVQFYMYDLKMFIASLIKMNAELISHVEDLTKCIDNIVMEKYVSPELIKKSEKIKEDWAGFSFYFPDEIDVSKNLAGLSKFYSVFSDLESFLSQNGYIQEFIFLYHKRDKILNQKK